MSLATCGLLGSAILIAAAQLPPVGKVSLIRLNPSVLSTHSLNARMQSLTWSPLTKLSANQARCSMSPSLRQ